MCWDFCSFKHSKNGTKSFSRFVLRISAKWSEKEYHQTEVRGGCRVRIFFRRVPLRKISFSPSRLKRSRQSGGTPPVDVHECRLMWAYMQRDWLLDRNSGWVKCKALVSMKYEIHLFRNGGLKSWLWLKLFPTLNYFFSSRKNRNTGRNWRVTLILIEVLDLLVKIWRSFYDIRTKFSFVLYQSKDTEKEGVGKKVLPGNWDLTKYPFSQIEII